MLVSVAKTYVESLNVLMSAKITQCNCPNPNRTHSHLPRIWDSSDAVEREPFAFFLLVSIILATGLGIFLMQAQRIMRQSGNLRPNQRIGKKGYKTSSRRARRSRLSLMVNTITNGIKLDR